MDGAAWYTFFSYMIVPDYDSYANPIIYSNLDGCAVDSKMGVINF